MSDLSNVPAQLKAATRWVVWRLEPKKDKPGEFTKVPYQAKAPNRNAASTRPATWATFDDAMIALSLNPDLSGAGFVFGDGWAGVDCDHCIDPKTGIIREWAVRIIRELDSYTEFSPRGEGVHIIVRGTLPLKATWHKRSDVEGKGTGLEMYDSDRFFTMTGRVVPDESRSTVEERTDALRGIHKRYEPPRKAKAERVSRAVTTPSADDSAILEKARRAKNGAEFRQLYDLGDWKGAGKGSHSEADLALCNSLLYWSDGDPAAADRLFRDSALYRAKWDSRRGDSTYGADTIALAVADYRPRKFESASQRATRNEIPDVVPLDIVRLADVEPEEISWLWPDRIAFGKLTIIEGHPGVGKGMLGSELAACASTGRRLQSGLSLAPFPVLFVGAEDANGDTVRPRLDAAGADTSLVYAFSTVGDRLLTFPADIGLLRRAIEQTSAKLVIIDPITNHLDQGLSPNKDVEIRSALTPLAKLAESLGVAIMVVRHLVKAASGSAITAGSGTIAFVGVARCVMVCAKDPEDEDKRVLATVKNNLGRTPPSLTFRLEETPNKRARVVWLGQSAHSADDLVAAARDDGERGATTEATELLREWLSEGEQRKDEVIRRAGELKIAPRTMERAAQRLHVVSERAGKSRTSHYVWRLPSLLIPANMASIEKSATQPNAAASPTLLANDGGEHENGKVVGALYQHACSGNCGLTFSTPGRTCYKCRHESGAA